MTEPQIESKAKKAKEVAHPEVKIPSYVGQSVTSILVFIMAATMRGMYRPGQLNWQCTMWKFQDFSASQILLEIDFVHIEAPKTAILTI